MPEKSAFHSRGHEIVAMPPPSINGQSQQGLIKVQQTTAPAKVVKQKPVQVLSSQLKHMDLINTIELKTELAIAFKQHIERYEQVDQFQFKKNSQKLADFLVWISDCEEVKLFSDEAMEVLQSIIQ